MIQPTLFDLVTGAPALAVVAPAIWVFTDDELAAAVEMWRQQML